MRRRKTVEGVHRLPPFITENAHSDHTVLVLAVVPSQAPGEEMIIIQPDSLSVV